MNDPRPIDLNALLRFEFEEGKIWLEDYRMVLLSACGLGALRKEMIETLGWDQARGLLKRFGYAAGLADTLALNQRFAESDPAKPLDLGPDLQALEGIAKVIRSPDREPLEPGAACGELWENSFEAEQHLDLYGTSDRPVCWFLSGYASGHASAASGQRVVIVETQCQAMGFERCQFVVATGGEAQDLVERETADYEPQHLPAILQELHETIEAKNRTIVQLRSEVRRAKRRGQFVGESATLSRALDTAQAVAPYGSTVLILGESGTGKELLARFVHDHSQQSKQAFVAVNCSALPESLQEAELFGYAKGAFTGAAAPHAGVFEAAHGGTLFLDEIGDLSLTAQTKILRALQEGEIKRLGETRTRHAKPRIIAATHRDLEAMVQEGTFREDLYYRLSVVVIPLPPLRDRGNDVLLLANHFLRAYASRFAKDVCELSHEAARTLAQHTWPGNVRELENVIQRAVILATSRWIEFEDLPETLLASAPTVPTATDAERGPSGRKTTATEDARVRLLDALERTAWNRERAASLLGMSRTTLWRRMKALGVVPPASD